MSVVPNFPTTPRTIFMKYRAQDILFCWPKNFFKSWTFDPLLGLVKFYLFTVLAVKDSSYRLKLKWLESKKLLYLCSLCAWHLMAWQCHLPPRILQKTIKVQDYIVQSSWYVNIHIIYHDKNSQRLRHKLCI